MTPDMVASSRIRLRLLVTGVVQGVGFRPFVYGLAMAHGLAGFVGNNSEGVFIEVEGAETAVRTFCHQLSTDAPPLAYIEAISSKPVAVTEATGFAITQSHTVATASTFIAPDMSICEACRAELLNPQDRRYGYPFINCTHCGPRFTIIKEMPYDRPFTTMAEFLMCADCQAEYDDPLNRRFHAQPNACPHCGPHVWLEMAGSPQVVATEQGAVETVQQMLGAGQIVAIKGVGGFHLACDAYNKMAVQQLRERKGRPDKPLAVMARDLTAVRTFAMLSEAEEALLTSPERPIVLLDKKEGTLFPSWVAPDQGTIGVMLPYSPLHLLLFHAFTTPASVLVMTSGNKSHQPIVTKNQEARAMLVNLADAFLMHNRKIMARCDDSVMRVLAMTVLPLRRSRGYVPFPIKLPHPLPAVLAVGGELKATFCLTKGTFAYLSQHVGDMENLQTLTAFETAVSRFQTLFRVKPERIACDLHPLYLSHGWAERQALEVVAVQHHHAHIAAVMAENQLAGDQPVLGFSFDGTGYGTDGAIWGGELLLADYTGYERLAHLRYFPLAGGDIAVKRPYRLALSYLWSVGLPWLQELPAVKACSKAEQRILQQQLRKNLNVVSTSSMGRLFDLVASLCGVRQMVTYEGQAAMALEAVSAVGVSDRYEFALSEAGLFDASPVVEAVVADLLAGVETAVISAKFHNAVAYLIVQLSLHYREKIGVNQVALTGGVFQNKRLLETAVLALQKHQFDLFTHRLVPPNDGGLALGQAMIAGMGCS